VYLAKIQLQNKFKIANLTESIPLPLLPYFNSSEKNIKMPMDYMLDQDE